MKRVFVTQPVEQPKQLVVSLVPSTEVRDAVDVVVSGTKVLRFNKTGESRVVHRYKGIARQLEAMGLEANCNGQVRVSNKALGL